MNNDDGILSLFLTIDSDDDAFDRAERKIRELLDKNYEFSFGGAVDKLISGANALVDAFKLAADIVNGLKNVSNAIIDYNAKSIPRWSYMAARYSPSMLDAMNSYEHNDYLKQHGITREKAQEMAGRLYHERSEIINSGKLETAKTIKQSEIAAKVGIAADKGEYFNFYANASSDDYYIRALDVLQAAVRTGDDKNVTLAQEAFDLDDSFVSFAYFVEQLNSWLRNNGYADKQYSLSGYLTSSNYINSDERRNLFERAQAQALGDVKATADLEAAKVAAKDAGMAQWLGAATGLKASIQSMELEWDAFFERLSAKLNGYKVDPPTSVLKAKDAGTLRPVIQNVDEAFSVQAGYSYNYDKKTKGTDVTVDPTFSDNTDQYYHSLMSGATDRLLDEHLYRSGKKDAETAVSSLVNLIAKLDNNTTPAYKNTVRTDLANSGGRFDALSMRDESTGAISPELGYLSVAGAYLLEGEEAKMHKVLDQYAANITGAVIEDEKLRKRLNIRENTAQGEMYGVVSANTKTGKVVVDVKYFEDDATAYTVTANLNDSTQSVALPLMGGTSD